MISHALQLAFIHVPKTAGTSIGVAIQEADPYAIGGHDKWPCYAQYGHYEQFAVVRNSWDRAWSIYNFIKMTHTYWHSPERLHPMHHLVSSHSFQWFLEFLVAEGAYHEHKLSWEPQSLWMYDDSDVLQVDQLLRFEELPACLIPVWRQFHLPKLRRLNVTQKPGAYRDAYNSRCRELVERLYGRDILLLGCQF